MENEATPVISPKSGNKPVLYAGIGVLLLISVIITVLALTNLPQEGKADNNTNQTASGDNDSNTNPTTSPPNINVIKDVKYGYIYSTREGTDTNTKEHIYLKTPEGKVTDLGSYADVGIYVSNDKLETGISINNELFLYTDITKNEKKSVLKLNEENLYLGGVYWLNEKSLIYSTAKESEPNAEDVMTSWEYVTVNIINKDGTGRKELKRFTDCVGYDIYGFNPATNLLYLGCVGDGGVDYNIATLNVSTGAYKRLYSNPIFANGNVILSEDFKKIYFVRANAEAEREISEYIFATKTFKKLYTLPEEKDKNGNVASIYSLHLYNNSLLFTVGHVNPEKGVTYSLNLNTLERTVFFDTDNIYLREILPGQKFALFSKMQGNGDYIMYLETKEIQKVEIPESLEGIVML